MISIFGQYNYWIVVLLMMIGFYIVISHGNLVKKLMGLSVFQTSVFILYITMGKVTGGTAPILDEAYSVYANPLPHVLILTAIVVGIATTALGLALVVRIKEAYGTIEESEIQYQDDLADEGGLASRETSHETSSSIEGQSEKEGSASC